MTVCHAAQARNFTIIFNRILKIVDNLLRNWSPKKFKLFEHFHKRFYVFLIFLNKTHQQSTKVYLNNQSDSQPVQSNYPHNFTYFCNSLWKIITKKLLLIILRLHINLLKMHKKNTLKWQWKSWIILWSIAVYIFMSYQKMEIFVILCKFHEWWKLIDMQRFVMGMMRRK